MSRRLISVVTALTLLAGIIAGTLFSAVPVAADTWVQTGSGGFGDPYNPVQPHVGCMASFGGKLYAGTTGGVWASSCQVWRYNGSGWAQVNETGFGDANNLYISSMAVFGAHLYVATARSGGSAQVWRTTGGTPCIWQQVGSGANISKAATLSISSMTTSGGMLYAGTYTSSGCEIWTFNGAGWTQQVGSGALVPPGFGDTSNLDATTMATSPAGEVFVGTWHNNGCEVWRNNGPGWTQANTNGFGDTDNMNVTALSFLGGNAFAGTRNFDTGAKVFEYTGAPGLAWTQRNTDGFGTVANENVEASIVFGGNLFMSTYNPSAGTYLYRYNAPLSWTAVNLPGFGSGNTVESCLSLAEHGGSLFAGPGANYEGALVYKATNTAVLPYAWTLTNQPGFTYNANEMASSSAVFNGAAYVGTRNDSGCEVWRRDASGWARVATDGFGDRTNTCVDSMAVLGDHLYAGTLNGETGCEVWRYDGTTWGRINTDGFGSPETMSATSMVVFNGRLYVGTESYDPPYGRLMRFNGPGPGSWTQVNPNGFGSDKHVAVQSLAVFGGKLYAGTFSSNDPCAVFRWDGTGATSWTQVNMPGFGRFETSSAKDLVVYNGRLYCTAFNRTMHGAEVWRYAGTGTSWTQVNANGFGDAGNITPESATVYGDLLYVGTDNASGGEVWAYNGSGWKMANTKGFGSADNYEVCDLLEYGGKLNAGTRNPEAGCQTWSTVGLSNAWYLAEGTSAWGFSTSVTIQNPNTTAATADIAYMTSEGQVDGGTVNLPAGSQTTVNPAEKVGSADFSTLVSCNQFKNLAVDRTMSWNSGAGEEGHSSVGVTSPGKDWYLAEGSSAWGFETWLLIQNPNSAQADCEVTYMIEGASPVTKTKTIPASSRQSFNIADDIGSKDASIMVSSDLPVIPERAMYRNSRREGHDSIGTTMPAMNFYLAEGTSAWGFTTYVLVQNPNDTETEVTVTYMTGSGPQVQAPFVMPAHSRKTIRVNDALPDTDFSTKVSADQPIIAERSMYWNSASGEACHDSIGMASGHKTFFLPDGDTSNGRETWTLVQNPNGVPVEVDITYMKPDGADNVTLSDVLPANSRKTYNMADRITGGRAAIRVNCTTAGKKIMVERAMYWNSRSAGTDTIGGFSD